MLTLVLGCKPWGDGPEADRVVVYSALDREFSEPLLATYGRADGRRGPAQVRRREHQDGRPDAT